VRVLVVDLEPEEVVGLERPTHADRLARLEVDVDVQADADVRTDGIPHRRDLRHRLLHDVARRHLVVWAEPALRDGARRLARPDDVGFERGVATRGRLARGVGQILQRLERLHAEQLPVVRAVRRQVRPVDPLAVAMRPAHELVDRHAQRLAGQIPQRQLDPGDRLLGRTVGRLADGAIEIDVMLLDSRRILPDQAMTEVLHQTDQAARDPVRPELAVAGEPRVGADRAEVPRARRREAVGHHERLDAGDLHVVLVV
jgi:hypothetical protein